MSHSAAIVDELANELATWPGVRLERLSEGSMAVFYESLELGLLDRERGTAQLRFPSAERERLVEEGDALPAESENVSHALDGPSDLTAVIELFDRRYSELRGEDGPYSSPEPA